MESAQLLEKISLLGLASNVDVIDKAKELLRKLNSKLPPGSLGRAESSRPVLAVEIACRVTSTPLQRGQIQKVCILGDADYTKALTTCKAALGVTWASSNIEQVLTMQYSAELVEQIAPIIECFRVNYYNDLPAVSREYVKLDSSLYKCAAFYVAATSNKQLKVDKAAVAALAETYIAQFGRVVESLRQVWEEHGHGGGGKGSGGSARSGSAMGPPAQRSGMQRASSSSASMGVENAAVGAASGVKGKETARSESNTVKASILQQIRIQNAANTSSGMPAPSVVESAPKLERKRGIGAVAMTATDYRPESGQSSTLASNAVGASNLMESGKSDATARAAYEVWKEAMQERKRAKLNR